VTLCVYYYVWYHRINQEFAAVLGEPVHPNGSTFRRRCRYRVCEANHGKAHVVVTYPDGLRADIPGPLHDWAAAQKPTGEIMAAGAANPAAGRA